MTKREMEAEIIKLWGSSQSYFAELERFIKAHEKADARTHHNEGPLVSVTYYFRPFQVWQEHQELIKKLKGDE